MVDTLALSSSPSSEPFPIYYTPEVSSSHRRSLILFETHWCSQCQLREHLHREVARRGWRISGQRVGTIWSASVRQGGGAVLPQAQLCILRGACGVGSRLADPHHCPPLYHGTLLAHLRVSVWSRQHFNRGSSTLPPTPWLSRRMDLPGAVPQNLGGSEALAPGRADPEIDTRACQPRRENRNTLTSGHISACGTFCAARDCTRGWWDWRLAQGLCSACSCSHFSSRIDDSNLLSNRHLQEKGMRIRDHAWDCNISTCAEFGRLTRSVSSTVQVLLLFSWAR